MRRTRPGLDVARRAPGEQTVVGGGAMKSRIALVMALQFNALNDLDNELEDDLELGPEDDHGRGSRWGYEGYWGY